MKFKKATPGTFVFNEIDDKGNILTGDDASIPSLYIRKSALSGPAQNITVTVEIEK